MTLRRALASFASLVVTVALLLPLALGPALAPLVTGLGGSEHACACGMKPGTCGCPECSLRAGLGDAVESRGLASTHATLRACDDHGRGALPGFLPPGLVPGALSIVESPTMGVLASPPLPCGVPLVGVAPPTPPPRLDLV